MATTKRPGATNGDETPAATRARTRGASLMATQNATRDDGNAEINDRTFAAYMVIEEHNRLADGTMALVGLIGDIQAGRVDVRVLKVENLRKAIAKTLFESRRNLTAGLLFAIDDDGPLDEKVIDAIAESGDECGEQFERIDAEIKAEREDR